MDNKLHVTNCLLADYRWKSSKNRWWYKVAGVQAREMSAMVKADVAIFFTSYLLSNGRKNSRVTITLNKEFSY